jgi:hypothetical protein
MASAVTSFRPRRAPVNTTNANTLLAGSGLDWFFAKYAKDTLNNKPTDSLN